MCAAYCSILHDFPFDSNTPTRYFYRDSFSAFLFFCWWLLSDVCKRAPALGSLHCWHMLTSAVDLRICLFMSEVHSGFVNLCSDQNTFFNSLVQIVTDDLNLIYLSRAATVEYSKLLRRSFPSTILNDYFLHHISRWIIWSSISNRDSS